MNNRKSKHILVDLLIKSKKFYFRELIDKQSKLIFFIIFAEFVFVMIFSLLIEILII
jgi:hypothetical protein